MASLDDEAEEDHDVCDAAWEEEADAPLENAGVLAVSAAVETTAAVLADFATAVVLALPAPPKPSV